MDQGIDYNLIATAINHYVDKGYCYHSCSWFETSDITAITCPDPQLQFWLSPNITLVGSAEQSFLGMTAAGMAKGKYVGATPCFRREPIIDELHQYSFFKVELFDSLNVTTQTLNTMIIDARDLFVRLGLKTHLVETQEGWDIMCGKYELGSYGIRTHKSLSWVYGTGLAEPRFSIVARKLHV